MFPTWSSFFWCFLAPMLAYFFVVTIGLISGVLLGIKLGQTKILDKLTIALNANQIKYEPAIEIIVGTPQTVTTTECFFVEFEDQQTASCVLRLDEEESPKNLDLLVEARNKSLQSS